MFEKEYSSWRKMKERCTNPNHDSYRKYGAKGITVEDRLLNSFEEFMNEVGPMPDYVNKYTLDRVDNNIGYVTGNLRWATPAQQCQNRRKGIRNKSGVRGVYKEATSWVCEIYDNKSRRIRERFSIKVHGEEFAFFVACERRDQLEIVLNGLGCRY